MPADKPDRTVQFVAKLVQLTQDGKMAWDPAPRPETAESAAFSTTVEGKQLRLYKARRQALDIDDVSWARPRTKMMVVPVLEVVDDFGQGAYSFENVTGLDDLYETASFSAAKVDELMDTVLRRS